MLLALLFACSWFDGGSSDDPASDRPVVGIPVVDKVVRRIAKKARSGSLERLDVEGKGIGRGRSAFVKVPKGEGPFPVIIAFHGGKTNTGRNMVERLSAAENRGILLVYPNATDLRRGTGWMGPDKTDEPFDVTRDLRYMDALLETLEASYDIDTEQVFAVGMSGGGYMTNLLWCEKSEAFAGFGVVARAMPKKMSRKCRPAKRTPYVLFLGTADEGVVTEEQLSFERTRDFIRDSLDCNVPPTDRRTIPARKDDMAIEHSHWDCGGDSTFDMYLVQGGGHHWPGTGKRGPGKCMDLNATEAMLEAFGLE